MRMNSRMLKGKACKPIKVLKKIGNEIEEKTLNCLLCNYEIVTFA